MILDHDHQRRDTIWLAGQMLNLPVGTALDLAPEAGGPFLREPVATDPPPRAVVVIDPTVSRRKVLM